MVNKALRTVLYTIFTISLLFVVPFNNTYADTITNSNVNINYYLESVTEVSTGSYLQTYKVDFVFDQSYLGWISSKLVGTYVSNNTLPTTTSQFTITKAIYVNGSIASTTVSFTTPNTISSGALQSLSQSIQNSNVTPLADLSTLDDILNVLNDIDTYVSINIIDELQDIVSNTSLSNDYLEILTEMRKYDFPIESYNIISYQFANNRTPLDFYNLKGYYTFPRFSIDVNQNICTSYFYGDYIDVVCLYSNPNGSFGVGNLGTNATFVNSEILNYFIDPLYGNSYLIRSRYRGSGNFRMYLRSGTNVTFIPIFCGYTQNISTDYALLFGLDNRLLNDIHLIANGTNASSVASSQSDQANSQLQQDSNTLFTQEDSFKQNMNSAMQNIDTTFTLNNFGQSFMTSAQWVRTQYETLTNNTPFASLITFSLLVGLALIVIGKVYK